MLYVGVARYQLTEWFAWARRMARKFGAETTVDIEQITNSAKRVARVREIVGGFGADLVMDCSGHPSAGPEEIEMLRDGGTFVEMGQFTDAGAIETNWHRICARTPKLGGAIARASKQFPQQSFEAERGVRERRIRRTERKREVAADGWLCRSRSRAWRRRVVHPPRQPNMPPVQDRSNLKALL